MVIRLVKVSQVTLFKDWKDVQTNSLTMIKSLVLTVSSLTTLIKEWKDVNHVWIYNFVLGRNLIMLLIVLHQIWLPDLPKRWETTSMKMLRKLRIIRLNNVQSIYHITIHHKESVFNVHHKDTCSIFLH